MSQMSHRWERRSLLLRMLLVVELSLLTRRMIEMDSVMVRIHILGSYANIAVARNAICNLIMGSPPNTVYNQMKLVAARQKERFQSFMCDLIVYCLLENLGSCIQRMDIIRMKRKDDYTEARTRDLSRVRRACQPLHYTVTQLFLSSNSFQTNTSTPNVWFLLNHEISTIQTIIIHYGCNCNSIVRIDLFVESTAKLLQNPYNSKNASSLFTSIFFVPLNPSFNYSLFHNILFTSQTFKYNPVPTVH